jgi:signal transduction histidine kinase
MRWGRRLDQSGPGAGLGLAIVAEIAEVWGASFSIEAPEQGCRVALRIPLARTAAAHSE